MSCNNNQDCGPNQHCADGQCIDDIQETPLRRKTFTTAWSEYAGAFKGEQQRLKDYGKMLKDDLDEAAQERKEAAAKQKDAGSKWGIFGTFLGLVLAAPTGGMSLALGATVGASAGYLAGSSLSDYQDKAEEYGLTVDELKALDSGSLKYLAGTHGDIYDEAVKMQENLDAYDANEWQNHVYGAIQAGWNVYKVANLAEGAWEVGKEISSAIAKDKTVEQVAEKVAGEGLEYSINTTLDNLINYDLDMPTFGTSSASGWGEDGS